MKHEIILELFWPVLQGLTLRTLRYATFLSSYVGVSRVTPWTTRIVVGVSAEVLPQVLLWVPIRIKPTGG